MGDRSGGTGGAGSGRQQTGNGLASLSHNGGNRARAGSSGNGSLTGVAGGIVRAMETQADGKGSGRAMGLAGIIGRAQGRGRAVTGVDKGQMPGTAGGSDRATGSSRDGSAGA